MAKKTTKRPFFAPLGKKEPAPKFGPESEGAEQLRKRIFGNEPLEAREAIARTFWETAKSPLGGCRTEAERERAVSAVGGPGLVAWCRAGFPAGKLMEYAEADFRKWIADKSQPLVIREGGVRELWNGYLLCHNSPTEQDRDRHITNLGGPGLLCWCIAGCPAGQMDVYREGKGAL